MGDHGGAKLGLGFRQNQTKNMHARSRSNVCTRSMHNIAPDTDRWNKREFALTSSAYAFLDAILVFDQGLLACWFRCRQTSAISKARYRCDL